MTTKTTGPVPGDQGGGPRRPQVGDRFEHYKGDPLGFVTLVAVGADTATCFDNDCRMCWDDGSEQDYHTSFLLGEYGSAWRPAPPAARGAAVAGTCDCRAFVTPASEPPPTPEEAAFLRGASLSVTKMAEQVRLLRVDLATATAAKAALEAARDNAVRERDEARDARTRALALATEHLEAKAALEVQLAEAARGVSEVKEMDAKEKAALAKWRDDYRRIFAEAGLEMLRVAESENRYCGDECCPHLPAVTVTTQIGDIAFWWRKRVTVIDWAASLTKRSGDDLFPGCREYARHRQCSLLDLQDGCREIEDHTRSGGPRPSGWAMSDETLRPCALCGADLHLAATEGEHEWGVECCGCDGILIFRPTRAEAIAAANRRADEARIRAEAMAERTREVEALLRQVASDQDRAGCSDEAFRALRIGITAIRASWPDAFPKPGSEP